MSVHYVGGTHVESREQIKSPQPRSTGERIYYERQVDGHRWSRSLGTSSWEEAEKKRDALERKHGIKGLTGRRRLPRRPKGTRYRHLHMRVERGSIYYERRWNRTRYSRSLETDDWNEAIARRDAFERLTGIGPGLDAVRAEVPTLAEMAERYITEDTVRLAETTRYDRQRLLRPDGPILAHVGDLRVDELRVADLREWWSAAVDRPGRSTKTGRTYLDALAAVVGYAADLELCDGSSVDGFRRILRRWNRTQRGRAESDPSRTIRAIEDPADVARLLHAASEEGPIPGLLMLLCLDAGLRRGEAIGLRWPPSSGVTARATRAARSSSPSPVLAVADRARPRPGGNVGSTFHGAYGGHSGRSFAAS